jgi:hypothetical protein
VSKKNNVFFISLFFILSITSFTECVIIGSESAVSVQPLASFPNTDSDNTMLGFGWFKNGFGLQDSTTTCTFNSVYPVSGTVDMAGGTLSLLQDLIFHNVTTLNGWGSILGNNCAVNFCSSINTLPSNAAQFEDTALFLNDDLVLTSSITFSGNCSFNGMGHSLILSDSAGISIAPGSSVSFQDIDVKGLAGTNISCMDDTGRILLNDVKCVLAGDFNFTHGSMYMQDNVTFMGTATFAYESSQTTTLHDNSTFLLTNGIQLTIGRDPITGNEPLAFTDSTSILKLSNCAYNIAPTGIALTKGTLFIDHNVSAHVNSTSFATGVILGSGSPADDFTVYLSPGSCITHYGHMTYNNSVPNLFHSVSDSTLLVREANSYVLANTNFQLPELTIQLSSNSVPPIAVTSGATLSFNQTSIDLPSVDFEITGIQQNAYTYVLPGNGSIFFSQGDLPLYLIIQNAGNVIQGNGSLNGAVTLQNSSAALLMGITGFLGNTLSLNGGTVTLQNDLMLYNYGEVAGPGTINLTNRVLYLNSSSGNWTTPILWQASNGGITLEQNLTLASTWTMQGVCVIDGGNNELSFSSGGEIIIESNSVLYLKNLRLQSIADVNIQCVDNTGILVLDDVYWTQTDDYHFQQGSISFINEVDLVGSYTFFYESTQTSTVGVQATLTIQDHMNLSIGMQQVSGAQQPLHLTDFSSLIVIDNAQWTITGNGMQLTKGRVICQNDVLVDIASTSSANGLTLGDTTPAGDMTFEFRPGTSVRMPRGDVVCNWYANNNVKSESNTAQLIRNAANTFWCNCSILLSNLNIQTEEGAGLNVATDKTFSYENCIFEVPGSVYLLQGTFYNAYTNMLNGDDYLFLLYGTNPLYTVVSGIGNVLAGSGSVSGEIIFLDSSANLTWAVNGTFMNNLMLNGGTFNLDADLLLGNGALILGPGIVDVGSYLVRFGSQDLMANTPINFNCTGGQIALQADLSLASTWTITGNCTIIGNGNTIDLGTTGQIVIDVGSSLYLQDVTLKNVGNTNIQCLDNAGVLTLDGVIWNQPEYDYTFGEGAIVIRNNVFMSGSNMFNYETSQTSTINGHSVWNFDSGMTLNYTPTSSSQMLISCADHSATLSLFETTVSIGAGGLQLTKGSLVVEGVCPFDIVGTTSSTGLILGDGISAGNDIEVVVMPESSLNIVSGYLNYQNVM